MADFRIADFAYTKVAHANLGENLGSSVPSLAVDDFVEKLESELVELVSQEQVEDEELANTIADEGELDEQVEHHQIVAQELARYAANPGEKTLEQQQRAARLFAPTRVVHVLIDCCEHVRHVLLSALVLVHRLVVRGRLYDVAHVDARATRQCSPCDVWNVEEERLRQQNEWHLIVFCLHFTLSFFITFIQEM
jgi:hypothetical protein